MEIQEIKNILLRNSETKELDDLSLLIDEAVNFGTHILNWEIEKNNSHRENAISQIFFKNILEIVDGISILVKKSSIDNTKVLFRVLLENILYLEYLLENDFKKRALAYIVTTIHKEIKFFSKLEDNTQVGKEFKAQLKKDKIFKNVPFFELPTIEKKKESFENKLQLPAFLETEQEYQRTLIRIKNPNWYSLYDGPHNIENLAKYLNHHSLYEAFYRGYSEDIHISNIVKSNLVEKKGEIIMKSMRESYEAKHIVSEILTCLIIAYSNFIIKRIPEKCGIYEKWHNDFTVKFDEL
ncbi:hypothetical protein GGR22_002909 [Flavobacterium gossypii]|uniref:Uncharacterized protein n=1 Tax=Flavobacterium gossypii TaxID=1646119 RepID=A0ABR6DTZ6_9FLAO|nr:DUF5677 domain-containing protein [Flavobacterium gossypii]MBA9074736.1 hypothetical protein [Flavobacterium gossypii]